MLSIPASLRTHLSRQTHWLAFVVAYVAMDWFSYIEPLFGMNLTPWNPAPALGLVYWLKYGKKTAPYWLAALLLSEIIVRSIPTGPPLTLAISLCLMLGYGLTGEWLRRRFTVESIFHNRRLLTTWIGIITISTFATSLVFLLLLDASGLIPQGEWLNVFIRFWIGDVVGILVTMPFLWLLANSVGRAALRAELINLETLGYLALSLMTIAFVFWVNLTTGFNRFYILFLPIVWAAARQGLVGAAFIAAVLQIFIVVVVEVLIDVDFSVIEFQLLGTVLALVGYFIGVSVDEQRKAVEDMKQTLRLAVAGDMATALAHELNQPITALSAYGKVCELLLAQGKTGDLLKDTIKKMVAESTRAADVVRRLRGFFQSGSVRLELIPFDNLLLAATQSSRQRAQERGVELGISPLPAIGVLADRIQIEVVMNNLLSNATDSVMAQPEGNRRIDLSAVVQKNRMIRLIIEDSGPGVSARIANQVFEPFFSSKSSGFGLGLVISRAIVEAHGGHLWVEVGEHGIFNLELPIAETNTDEK